MLNQALTIDQLPTAFAGMSEKVDEILSLLRNGGKLPASEPEDTILNVAEAAHFLKLKCPTIYLKCSNNEIPYFKKGGKNYFSKKELTEWLKSGKVKTNEENRELAASHISNPNKKK